MNEAVLQTEDIQFAAKVLGTPLTELPKDLYIPPEALQVFLETFEGPLDLLLYLIRKQNLDILEIPIAEITRQYMHYVELMKVMQIELAAEYLVMAAMLAEIKSRLLLPRPETAEGELEGDPRAELIRRLQEYERYKKAAENLDQLERVERDFFIAEALPPSFDIVTAKPTIELKELLDAVRQVMTRAKLFKQHHIQKELLSIRERMTIVLSTVKTDQFTSFVSLFKAEEGRMGVVVTLIAILELIRQSIIEVVQAEPFAPIYLRARGEHA